VKIGANKKQYLDLVLGDKTGEITGKKWDVSDEELPSLMEIKEGDVIKIRANVTEWNGLKQFRVMRIRKTSSGEHRLVTLQRPLPVMRSFFPRRPFFSNNRTRAPCWAAIMAANIPAGPPPITIPSYFIGYRPVSHIHYILPKHVPDH
jgi:hypothetical protein